MSIEANIGTIPEESVNLRFLGQKSFFCAQVEFYGSADVLRSFCARFELISTIFEDFIAKLRSKLAILGVPPDRPKIALKGVSRGV